MATAAQPILDVRGLTTVFRLRGGPVTAVADLDLAIGPSETVALVGESGSGKSVTNLSIMGLLPGKVGQVAQGSIRFRGKDGQTRDLATLDAEAKRRIR